MNVSKELLEKAKTAKKAEELIEMAKAENIELSDEELDNVSGGCSPSAPPKYHVGDYVKYYYQYEFTWTYECTATGTSIIEDIKADGSTWMYKLEAGSWDGAEYIKEDRIISLA